MSKQGVRVAVVLVFFRMLAYASAERLLSVASLSLQESDVGDDDVRIFSDYQGTSTWKTMY